MYKITLSDGTVIDNLAVNGSNFVSRKELKKSDFVGKLTRVVISCDEEIDDSGLVGEHLNMELIQIANQ